ncbi:hypothetical protein GGTG_02657 [Gaeumannomyces tritici R3-111a-1]|uniref:Uncharacterized protein n=1 Tax=Gaeumannomyces tritici (strain R3-111a-1) TaxID=644352 RepID=J3NMZ9_GAET3|nr:hypothetical protein GGTG_02657 [Gaeumannomyces tritici R3-111a-1]EJT77551.1 hypothetical protein GGTG_02657 [Gaeumannomyces tritici R3-111a-1]
MSVPDGAAPWACRLSNPPPKARKCLATFPSRAMNGMMSDQGGFRSSARRLLAVFQRWRLRQDLGPNKRTQRRDATQNATKRMCVLIDKLCFCLRFQRQNRQTRQAGPACVDARDFLFGTARLNAAGLLLQVIRLRLMSGNVASWLGLNLFFWFNNLHGSRAELNPDFLSNWLTTSPIVTSIVPRITNLSTVDPGAWIKKAASAIGKQKNPVADEAWRIALPQAFELSCGEDE